MCHGRGDRAGVPFAPYVEAMGFRALAMRGEEVSIRDADDGRVSTYKAEDSLDETA